MQDLTLKALLEAGCHFGHQVNRWHPLSKPYIFTARDGIHIIDLSSTKKALEEAGEFVSDLGKKNKVIVFVSTKRQAKETVEKNAADSGLCFLTHRWIGGFLTNWEEVKKNIDKLNRMRQEEADGFWDKFPKHERVKLAKELRKLEVVYKGVASLEELPDCLFIVDIRREETALNEAKKMKIPLVAIVDTNCDPTRVDHPIPANDDAVASIKLITKYIADCYKVGKDKAEKNTVKAKKAD